MTVTGYRLAGRAAPRLASLSRRLLPGVLFATVLSSFLVFIEPAPYEGLLILLALVAAPAGFRLDRALIPLLLYLLVWIIGGLLSLLPVLHEPQAVSYLAISGFLAFSAVLFAGVLIEPNPERLELIRRAYIAAGAVAALTGVLGYFQIIPGGDLFTLNDRARGTFKDPNVFGPFLIPPLLFLAERMITDGIRPHRLVTALLLATGLFLSFSRGAWLHFVVSGFLLVALMLITAPSPRVRLRILGLSLLALVGVSAVVAALLSFDAIGAIFSERASLLQDYDSPESGRFGKQIASLPLLLERPNGFGPLQFRDFFGQEPHNVYLNAFASYGWLGGLAYGAMIGTTLFVGLRQSLRRTPWQPYLTPVVAAFAGVAVEGFVVDTDHWRHFYLLLGIIWGGAAMTARATRVEPRAPQADARSTIRY